LFGKVIPKFADSRASRPSFRDDAGSSHANGESIDRLKGTFPHVVSTAREAGRVVRSRITSSGFCYQDTGLKCLFKLNCAVEILGSKMPGVVSASSSAEAIGGGDRRAEFIIGRALAQPVGYSAPLAAAKVYFSLLKSASKLPKVGVRVIE
jgi:hypothetical protein